MGTDCSNGADEDLTACCDSGAYSAETCGTATFECGDGICDSDAGEVGGDSGCYVDCGCLEGEVDCGAAEDGWYGNCIPGSWQCDGLVDCNTGADEVDCGAPPSCEDQGLWDCGDGQCINPNWVCDGSSEFCNATWGPDCSNGADEGLESCGYADECGSGFTCTDGSTVDYPEDCTSCAYDWTAYGAASCDAAWDAFGLTCAQLESNYFWDCTGCTCPGDSAEPDPCVEAGGNLSWLGDGYCDSGNNNAGCGYDNGDCCPGDCTDGTYSCDSFGGDCNDCINPDSADNNGGQCDIAYCEDEAACNTGAEGDCSYPDTGYNCDGTIADGYHVDCAGTVASDYYLSYIGDGWCDGVDAAYGVNYQCCEFNFDNGDCGDALGCGGIAEGCEGSEADACGNCGGDGTGGTGDLNVDCAVDVLDVVALVYAVVDGELLEGGDLNGDGSQNVIDVVNLVNIILGSGRVADATSASMILADNSVSITSDGYIGGIQMTLSHDNGFELNLTNNAMVAEYKTSGTSTILVVVEPNDELIFTTNQSFEIVEMIVANSNDEIEVNTISEFGLSSAYPNPFNPSTSVSLTVPSADYVSVKVYNLMGQMVGTLAEGMMEASVYTFTWDASDMSSGVYLIKAESSSSVDIQKVLLVK